MANELVKIEFKDGKAYIKTPYLLSFARKMRANGGDWSGDAWVVPEAAVKFGNIREILRECYGYDDTEEPEFVTVKVTVKEDDTLDAYQGPVVLFTKILASASGRDSGAKSGEDVYYVKGCCYSSGSIKNWYSTVEENSEIILSHVPKRIFEKRYADLDEEAKAEKGYVAEILEDESKTEDREALIAEKERLLKRIAEIDKILGK